MSSPKPVTKLVQTQKKENVTVFLLKILFSVKYEKKYGKYDTLVMCLTLNKHVSHSTGKFSSQGVLTEIWWDDILLFVLW